MQEFLQGLGVAKHGPDAVYGNGVGKAFAAEFESGERREFASAERAEGRTEFLEDRETPITYADFGGKKSTGANGAGFRIDQAQESPPVQGKAKAHKSAYLYI
jgi:hypothetical protein